MPKLIYIIMYLDYIDWSSFVNKEVFIRKPAFSDEGDRTAFTRSGDRE